MASRHAAAKRQRTVSCPYVSNSRYNLTSDGPFACHILSNIITS